jgi:hypothetical protein
MASLKTFFPVFFRFLILSFFLTAFSQTPCNEKSLNQFLEKNRWDIPTILPKKELIFGNKLSSQKELVAIKIYWGEWCTDSEKWVPLAITLFSTIKNKQLTFIELNQEKLDSCKQKPQENILFLPTFIFCKNDHEVGRIIENPSKKGLAHDLYKILNP